VRTTVDIESDILKELKKAAAKKGVSFREVLNAALRIGLLGRHTAKPRKPYICPTFPMGQPSANLDKALSGVTSIIEVANDHR
jgi:hypothetical protein